MTPTTGQDFDFESSTAEFHNEKSSSSETESNSNANLGATPTAYDKNDFFDSISCDALDKRDGVDNRLRGAAERNLNTETFGAVSLGNGRRGGRRHNHRRNGNAGRGGRGNGNTNTSSRPREQNQRWKRAVEGDGSGRPASNGFAQPPTARAGGDR